MGSLFSTLDIARSGLQAAQVQLEVAAHNIANVNTEGFSRQRADLTSRSPVYKTYGALGRGVEVVTIERLRDAFLDKAYRLEAAGLGEAEIKAQYYAQIEDIFLEPSEDGFGDQLDVFFDALNDFANSVEELTVRQSVIAEAETLAASLNQIAERFELLRTEANEEVKTSVEEINSLAERIAFLNDQILSVESGDNQANDLRDQRDLLIDELAGLVDITARERENGQVEVLIGSDQLVSGANWRTLEAVRNAALDDERQDLVEVRFVDNGELADVTGGSLFAALDMRDTIFVEYDQYIDDLAGNLIYALNRIQNQGNGLVNLSGTITSTNAVSDAGIALDSAGLPFAVTDGTFDVMVYDATGTLTSTTTITVTAATTTLTSLAADLDAISGISASVVDGVLEISSDGDNSFTFANDSSEVLTALGVNGVFTGHDARTIAVSEHIRENPSMLTSGYSLDVLETGDNTAALEMAGLRNALLMDSGTATLNDYYESIIVNIGVEAQANEQALVVGEAAVADIEDRRLAVSGVSLDEEVTFMLQFQHAYEAAARVVTVADNMLETLLSMAL